jgi:hypothetical protein
MDILFKYANLLSSFLILQGTYNVKLTFKNQDDKRLTCVVFPFTIGAKSSVSAI